MERIHLTLKTTERRSEIFVGYGLFDFVTKDLRERPVGNRLGIITDAQVEALLGGRLQELLMKQGLKTDLFAIKPGEASKCWDTALSIFEWMAGLGFDRKSALLGLGGGVVGDITGFVASLYMRSIPYLQIPTTLLAQVDSALGGKTAIDLPGRKNLLGTFHQPLRVYADPSLLRTLSYEEVRNGLAEVAKSAIVRDPLFFQFLEDHRDAILSGEPDTLVEMVSRCCRIKTAVVMEDEHDAGTRQILNFGHTVGHAIEAFTDYRVAHGRAVSMGVSVETVLASRLKMLATKDEKRILQLLEDFGLPIRIPGSYDLKRLVSLMHWDKKAEDGRITVVLPTTIGDVSVQKAVPPSLIESVLRELQE